MSGEAQETMTDFNGREKQIVKRTRTSVKLAITTGKQAIKKKR